MYFNLAKISVLRLFKMTENQTTCFRFAQRSFMKLLMAEKCTLCETYRRMCYKACFNQKMLPVYDSPIMISFWSQQPVKKVMLTVF